jgi:CheY-like chemotaxis protein
VRWFTGIALVVDREDEALKLLRTALQSSDYVVLHATTGNEALAVLSGLKFPVDLAIIDLELPSDDGVVINLLTILGGQQPTKLIVKTSRHDALFLESVNYFGIDAIILKPIAEGQLIQTVRETLGGLGTVLPGRPLNLLPSL